MPKKPNKDLCSGAHMLVMQGIRAGRNCSSKSEAERHALDGAQAKQCAGCGGWYVIIRT
jgi:hypothetical protein